MPLYRELVKLMKKTICYVRRSVAALKLRKHPLARACVDSIQNMIELAMRVVDQTERRALAGESVPASSKIVSIFEPHTDFIRKGGRETHCGHKRCLSAGPSNLITNGFATKDNLTALKALNIKDVIFSKRVGLEP